MAARTQKSHLSADKRQPGCAGMVSLQLICGPVLLMRLLFGRIGTVLILIGTQISYGTFLVLLRNVYYQIESSIIDYGIDHL